jgi:hypothetical protein
VAINSNKKVIALVIGLLGIFLALLGLLHISNHRTQRYQIVFAREACVALADLGVPVESKPENTCRYDGIARSYRDSVVISEVWVYQGILAVREQ